MMYGEVIKKSMETKFIQGNSKFGIELIMIAQ